MKAVIVAAIVCACYAVCTASAQPQYVAAFLPATNLSGYELATLADIRSDGFAQQYNSVGINFIQSFAGSICCVVSVAEGFVVFGPNSTYFNYVEPYQGGTDICTTGLSPNGTTFGVPSFFPGPYSGTWLSQLDAKERAALRVTTTAPSTSYAQCQGAASSSQPFTAIFKSTSWTPTPAPTTTPTYVVRPMGPNYPAPASYREMFLSDVRSTAFQQHYNANGGILLTGVESTNYCCLIQVADGGWMSYGAEGVFSPLSLVLPNSGQWQCGLPSANQIHWFGTSFGGNDPAVLPALNATSVQLLGYFRNNTQDWDGCSGLPDSLTLFMKVE